jgi:hypothetical protein
MKQTLTAGFPQPRWFRYLNKLWASTYPLGTKIKLDKDTLIRQARKTTGLTDLGIDFWDEPLHRMLGSMNDEAHLSPAGRFISSKRLVNLLGIRLRATEYFRRFPEILELELYPAWIIVGLQRTGTTKLHRLLSVDPGHRVIPSWEAINPVPFGEPRAVHSGQEQPAEKRIRIARNSVHAVKLISPGFFAVHPLAALEPEEDVLLLDISFMSTTTEAMMHVPSYSRWLESVDQTPAYTYYGKLLRLMQWLQPGKRWILKSPHHLEFLPLMDNLFPDVRFIWPHRSVGESIPSFLSMLTYNHMIFSEQVDPRKIAERWIRKTGYVLDRAMKFREEGDHSHKFLDILYSDLVADSLKELQKIYRQDGGLTSDLADRFIRHEREHPYRKHGVHRYSLADFGITATDLELRTAGYQCFLSSLHGRQS